MDRLCEPKFIRKGGQCHEEKRMLLSDDGCCRYGSGTDPRSAEDAEQLPERLIVKLHRHIKIPADMSQRVFSFHQFTPALSHPSLGTSRHALQPVPSSASEGAALFFVRGFP